MNHFYVKKHVDLLKKCSSSALCDENAKFRLKAYMMKYQIHV